MDNLVIYAEVLREDISVFNCYGNIKICKMENRDYDDFYAIVLSNRKTVSERKKEMFMAWFFDQTKTEIPTGAVCKDWNDICKHSNAAEIDEDGSWRFNVRELHPLIDDDYVLKFRYSATYYLSTEETLKRKLNGKERNVEKRMFNFAFEAIQAAYKTVETNFLSYIHQDFIEVEMKGNMIPPMIEEFSKGGVSGTTSAIEVRNTDGETIALFGFYDDVDEKDAETYLRLYEKHITKDYETPEEEEEICKELDRLETNKLSPTALERLSTRTYSNM